MKTQASLATAAALFASVASAVDTLSIQGSNFVNNATGDRFDIIGVTYVTLNVSCAEDGRV